VAVPALAEARQRIADAVALTRYQPTLETPAISEALHRLALLARQHRATTLA
jgi:hypothetical protein